MEKLFQVFVSSTYHDLVDERREIMEALLGMNCIPTGMELFPAADDDQWTLIRRIIDRCDYYVLISGGRYGSLHPSGKSYTHLEYEHAISVGKPIIALLHRKPEDLPSERRENTPEGRVGLERLREAAKEKHHVRFWAGKDELAKCVYQGMMFLIRERPSSGWIRGDKARDESEALRMENKILTLERELEPIRRAGLADGVLTPYTDVQWGALFANCRKLDLLFSYAQTWRRSRTVELQHLARTADRIRVVLPDPDNAPTVAELSRRFACTEQELRRRILDAARHFLTLKAGPDCRATISVWFYPFAPQYTFYTFDNATVLSLYSHREARSGVITMVLREGAFREYLKDEFRKLIREGGKARLLETIGNEDESGELYDS